MKAIKRFACEHCKAEYLTAKEAKDCESKGFTPTLKVRDIVFARCGFGWFDGDKRWVSNPRMVRGKCPNDNRNCFDECCTYKFFYVVSAIDGDERDAHRPRYHLATGAMSGKQGYRLGYTFDIHRCTPVKIDKPPKFVKNDSKKFIGQKAKCLL